MFNIFIGNNNNTTTTTTSKMAHERNNCPIVDNVGTIDTSSTSSIMSSIFSSTTSSSCSLFEDKEKDESEEKVLEFEYRHWFTTPLEQDFNYYKARRWFRSTIHYPFIICAIYIITIFSIKRMIKHREPFKLRTPLIVWNVTLAIFSLIGSFRTIGYNVSFALDRGLHASICQMQPVNSGPYALWIWLFIMSKIPELGDTIFIVLRKQKLIFLHWFHHCSVLLLVWWSNSRIFSIGGYFMCMNYVVHSIMYTYYAMRSMGIKLPKSFAMSITTSQLTQMVIGTYVTYYAFREQLNGRSCDTHPSTIYMSLFLYMTYLILFVNFFVHSYFRSMSFIDWKRRLARIINWFAFDYFGVKLSTITNATPLTNGDVINNNNNTNEKFATIMNNNNRDHSSETKKNKKHS